MLLEMTITQLDIGEVAPDRAAELAMFGYAQWLTGLPGCASYHAEARRALEVAAPFAARSPAVADFRSLIAASMAMPPRPLALKPELARRRRRGGASARRAIP